MQINNIRGCNQAFGVNITQNAEQFINRETKTEYGAFSQTPDVKMTIKNAGPDSIELTDMSFVKGKADYLRYGKSTNYYNCSYNAGVNCTVKYDAPWGKTFSLTHKNLLCEEYLYKEFEFGQMSEDEKAFFEKFSINDETENLKSSVVNSCDELCRKVLLSGAKSGQLYANMDKLLKDLPNVFNIINSKDTSKTSFLYKLMKTSAIYGHLTNKNIEILKTHFPYIGYKIEKYGKELSALTRTQLILSVLKEIFTHNKKHSDGDYYSDIF